MHLKPSISRRIYFWTSNEMMLFLPRSDFRLWATFDSACTRAASEVSVQKGCVWAKTGVAQVGLRWVP